VSTEKSSIAAPYAVDMTMHAGNRARVCAALRAGGAAARSVLLLEGGKTPTFHETDQEPLFRQESNFAYLFGVKEPDCFGYGLRLLLVLVQCMYACVCAAAAAAAAAARLRDLGCCRVRVCGRPAVGDRVCACRIVEVDTCRATLFVPRLPAAYGVWMGAIRTTDDFRAECEPLSGGSVCARIGEPCVRACA
jgi:hypothetical protein